MASFSSLENSLVERELLPRLDLPSALSLSFCSKALFNLNKSKTSTLGSHLRKSFINDNHPIKKVFLDLLKLGYDSLLKEFLALRFRAALRSFSDSDFTEILSEALAQDRLDLYKVILGVTKRRIIFTRELIVALGKSGNVTLIKDLLDQYSISDLPMNAPHLLEGAATAGMPAVMEWLQTELGGKSLGFVYLMMTKASVAGNLNVLEWVRANCATDLAYEEAFAEAPIFSLASDRGINVVKYVYQITNTIPYNILSYASKFGNLAALEWAFEVKAEFDAPEVIANGLEHGRLDFLKRFLELVPKDLEIPNEGFLEAALKSMDLAVISWAFSRFNLDVASVDDLELVDTFFQNYAGFPEHEEIWKFLIAHGMKFDLAKYRNSLVETGESDSVFDRSSNFFIRTAASIDFVTSLGFTISASEILESLNEYSVDSLVRLRTLMPEAFADPQAMIEAAFDANTLALIKFVASIYPSEVVLDVTQSKVYELLFLDSLHVLDWIFKTFPKGINWPKLFEHFIQSEDLSLGITHFNGLQWLADHGIKLQSELFATAIEGNAHSSFFMFLLDNKVPMPANLSQLLTTAELSDADKKRIEKILTRGKN